MASISICNCFFCSEVKFSCQSFTSSYDIFVVLVIILYDIIVVVKTKSQYFFAKICPAAHLAPPDKFYYSLQNSSAISLTLKRNPFTNPSHSLKLLCSFKVALRAASCLIISLFSLPPSIPLGNIQNFFACSENDLFGCTPVYLQHRGDTRLNRRIFVHTENSRHTARVCPPLYKKLHK